MEECYICGDGEAEEYTHATINQYWAGENIPSELMGEDTCWLCKGCKKDEWDYDSKC